MSRPPQAAAAAPPTMSERIADSLVSARFEDLPPEVIRKAKELIVFFFGRAFEGASQPMGRQALEVAAQIEQPHGATVIGASPRLLPADAAFVNCSQMRGSTRDDVTFPAGIHAGVITLPTALAIGELRHASGRELLLGMVLGYEVLGTLGRVTNSWAARFPRRPTIIFGGYGPVTVAAHLMGLDRERMSHALGFAANLGMGIPEGGMVNHFYSLINRSGILAAQLVEAGADSFSNTTIEGELGLYRSFFGEIPEAVEESITSFGSDWEILTAEPKVHPGTGQSAVAIELMLGLVRQHGLTADNVAKIDVFLPTARSFREEYINRGPFNALVEAYSSLPYALALILVDGRPEVERYKWAAPDSVYNDPAVAQQMQKVSASFEEGHAVERYVRLEVHTTDGRKVMAESDTFLFPFPPSVWGDWLQEDGARLLPLEQLQKLEHLIGDLENLDDVSELMATVVPAGRSG